VLLAGPDGGEIGVAFVADRAVAAEEVHALCKKNLPGYMLPARVVQLSDLPRNANGKVDRRATKALIERAG